MIMVYWQRHVKFVKGVNYIPAYTLYADFVSKICTRVYANMWLELTSLMLTQPVAMTMIL